MEEERKHIADLAKQWVAVDGEMAKLRGYLRERRKRQAAISTQLWTFAKKSNVSKLAQKDGTLRFKKKIGKKNLSLKAIRAILLEFHEGNRELAEQETKFILDKRDTFTRESIDFRRSVL